MNTYEDLGIQIPQAYLPRESLDLTKWAVIACDQFTSQPDYWKEVARLVGMAPSTLNLVLPEVYLEKPGEVERVHSIQAKMHEYLEEQILQPYEGIIYVERTVEDKTRKGIIICLDLEQYDFTKGSTSLIRATEGTIVERLPPRMKIREGAELELPHILVLIDDPKHTVINPLEVVKSKFKQLYDFDLMLGSGHLSGYAIGKEQEERIVKALRELARPDVFQGKYNVDNNKPVLLFAMGDGNHSLATAKAVWEKSKPNVGIEHPARYAMVEVENVHDEGLEFEPIHRVVFGLKKDLFASLHAYFGANLKIETLTDSQEIIERVDNAGGPEHVIGIISGRENIFFGILEISNPPSNLPVGTLQTFLDGFLKEDGAEKIDYVHGQEVVCSLGSRPGNAGFYIPGMNKSDLFKTVILDGALPRKTFSMGEAKEKRFYMEARKIK
jgi:uncharacterized protein (DUF1015 family)